MTFSIRTADYGAVANREAWICAELKYKRDPGRIWYVPNATEKRFFTSREYTDKSPRNCFMSALARSQGRVLSCGCIRSSREKNSRNPTDRRRLFGRRGPCKDVLRARTASQVSVLPFVTREDMPAVYAAHDIFVFPSLVEGMPLTLLEAMATGMPVVTTNTCGMSDVVEDEFNGLLVPTANAGVWRRRLSGSAALPSCASNSVKRASEQPGATHGSKSRKDWKKS